MAHSIIYNFSLNLINTILGLLFPIVTFPYISHVLDPSGVGLVAFFSAINNYIILLTSLGIPLYAIREISKVRENIEVRNKTTAEILLLHFLLTLIGYIIVVILCFTVQRIYEHLIIYLILSLSIGFTTIGVNWFYQGIEDFKYITVRSVLFKIISFVALFILVQNKSDVEGYACVTVISTVGNNILNLIRLRKYFSQCKISYKDLQIMRHLRPALKIFLLNLITSIYLNLDSVMLGFMKNDSVVGLYAAASRIVHVFLTILTSLGSVLLPRLSNCVASSKWNEFSILKDKAIQFVFMMGLPLSIGLIIVAPEFMILFAGAKYIEAIPTVRILAPIIFFVGLSGILGLQILYSVGKENLVIICTATGASINLITNIILIPQFNQDGAAIATVLAEFSVLLVMVIIGKRYIDYHYLNKQIRCILMSVAIMTLTVLYIHITLSHHSISILSMFAIEVFLGGLSYFVVLYFSNNKLALSFIATTKRFLQFPKK